MALAPINFAPLLVMVAFVSIIVIAGLGNLRARTLWAWALAAAAICAALAIHSIFRNALVISGGISASRLWPAPQLWPSLAGGEVVISFGCHKAHPARIRNGLNLVDALSSGNQFAAYWQAGFLNLAHFDHPFSGRFGAERASSGRHPLAR